ncbi:hypothetical protein LguiA_002133 [Lonicera macranthoides]
MEFMAPQLIETQTLKGMPEYRGKTIRRADMGKVARDLMNAEGKDTNCLKYVENLRDEYGNGGQSALHHSQCHGRRFNIQCILRFVNVDTTRTLWEIYKIKWRMVATHSTLNGMDAPTTTIATSTTTTFVGIMSLTPPPVA